MIDEIIKKLEQANFRPIEYQTLVIEREELRRILTSSLKPETSATDEDKLMHVAKELTRWRKGQYHITPQWDSMNDQERSGYLVQACDAVRAVESFSPPEPVSEPVAYVYEWGGKRQVMFMPPVGIESQAEVKVTPLYALSLPKQELSE